MRRQSSNFITFLDESLKGDSTSPVSPEVVSLKKCGRDDDTSFPMLAQSTDMIRILNESAFDRKEASKERKKLAKDCRLLMKHDCAKMLDDKEAVRKLMKELDKDKD
jgi:hypothetical protein